MMQVTLAVTPALITMFDRPTFLRVRFIDPDVNISGTSPSGRSLKADNIAPTAWVPEHALCCTD